MTLRTTHSHLNGMQPSVQTHVGCATCYTISLNDRGQLCLLICAGRKDLSDHARMNNSIKETGALKSSNTMKS